MTPPSVSAFEIIPAIEAQSSGSVPNEREPIAAFLPDDTSVTGAKSRLKPSACRLPGDLLPGGIGRGGVGGLADGLHRADAGVDVKAARLQAGDRAALLVHAEEQRNFGIRLRIFQQRDGLCAVLQVLAK